MFEASIQMCLSRQQHNVLEMCMVDVCIYSKQSLEYDFDDVDEVLEGRELQFGKGIFSRCSTSSPPMS